jgi:hypothetical protein
MTKLYLTCNWDTNENISKHWESKLDKITFPSITFTNIRDEADYYIVFNKPNISEGNFNFTTKNTILIRMEPFMETNVHLWGEWSTPDYSFFKSVISPPQNLNFVEWHLNKSFTELLNNQYLEKTKGNTVSVIISDKYQDEGQIKRIDFIKYLQKNHSQDIQLDIYGKGNLSKWGIKNHIGELPLYCKDNGIIPYKYHFNCENSFSLNYVTEKLYDGVLSNTLTFYCGAFNVNSLYPNGGFIALDLDDFKTSAKIMINAVKNDKYTSEIDKIQHLKLNILNNCTFSKRINDIINNDIHQVSTYSWDEIQNNFNDIVKFRHEITSEVVPQLSDTLIEQVVPQPGDDNSPSQFPDLIVCIQNLTNSINKLVSCLNKFSHQSLHL